MELGLLLPTRERVLRGDPSLEPILALSQEVEAAGLDSVWVSESPLVRARPDAPTLLAAVGARTSTIAVGSAVMVAPLRHPVPFLHQVATLDQLTQGRLVLGLGAGYPMPQTDWQLTQVGVDPRSRVARLEDTVRLAHHLWRGSGAGGFTGRSLALEALALEPGPHRAGGPPLWLAGSGANGLRRAGALADGWLPYPPTPEQYESDLAVVRRHAADAGRPAPTAGLYVTLSVDPDRARASERADEYLGRYYDLAPELVRAVQATCTGTHDEVFDQLCAYQDAGAEHLVVRIAGDIDAELLGWLDDARQRLRARRGGTEESAARRSA